MTGWLRVHVDMTNTTANRVLRTGRRVRALPHTAAAWLDGRLSDGQIEVIVANVTDRRASLFADHEGALIESLAALDVYTSLVLRDLHCRFPGCDRKPEWCEGHHVVHWQDGGPTKVDSLVLLCSYHHHWVHPPGWHLKLLPSGTVEVTAPDGTVRTGDPPLRC